jgi:hypothetical protein
MLRNDPHYPNLKFQRKMFVANLTVNRPKKQSPHYFWRDYRNISVLSHNQSISLTKKRRCEIFNRQHVRLPVEDLPLAPRR